MVSARPKTIDLSMCLMLKLLTCFSACPDTHELPKAIQETVTWLTRGYQLIGGLVQTMEYIFLVDYTMAKPQYSNMLAIIKRDTGKHGIME